MLWITSLVIETGDFMVNKVFILSGVSWWGKYMIQALEKEEYRVAWKNMAGPLISMQRVGVMAEPRSGSEVKNAMR